MYFQVHEHSPNRNSSDTDSDHWSFLSQSARSCARDISTNSSYGAHKRTMHSLPFILVWDTGAIYRAHYYQRGCSCTGYAGISALAQLLSPRLAAAWPPASYLDSNPDKQGLLSPSPCQASTTARARVFALLGNPAPGGFGGLGSVGSVGPHRTLPLCITRQLLSAAAIRHRRLLHGITVKRASLRAFPP